MGVVSKRKNSFGNEAFSAKIMEFMAMGVPVVASNTMINQLYFNQTLVQFFESESVEDLAAKILDLMNLNLMDRLLTCGCSGSNRRSLTVHLTGTYTQFPKVGPRLTKELERRNSQQFLAQRGSCRRNGGGTASGGNPSLDFPPHNPAIENS